MSEPADLVAGRWELLEPIASGGTSTVWRAFDHRVGRECAAKVLRRRDAGELMRFVREQSVRLDHPHVVAPYGWAAEDATVLIASELVDGGSLLTLVGDVGPLDDATVVAVLDQLLDALGAVHDAGLIHRDVKPGNVLLRAGDGPLDVALVDFGIALATSDARLTASGMVVGTPGYVPPEVLRGAQAPQAAHDLFAVGQLAVVLLVGREGASLAEALTLARDPALRITVSAMLSGDPAARPRDVAAARALLGDAVRSTRPHNRDGDPIVVLRQLPEAGRSRAVEPGSKPIRPTGDELSTQGAPSASAGAAPTAPANPDPTAAHTTPTTEELATGSFSEEPLPSRGELPGDLAGTRHTAAPARRARSRRWPVARRGTVLSVIGLVAVLALAAWLVVSAPWADSGSGTGPPPTGDGSTQSPSAAASATPTGPAGASVGQACSWQEEGDRRPSPDGELRCTLSDGAYTWQVP